MTIRENVDQSKTLKLLKDFPACSELTMLQTVHEVMRKPDSGTEWDVPLYVQCWQLACQLFCVE